jgi:hypothetical protein
MGLDEELRELFESDRLDVRVRADAEDIIVSGARRVRRRRIAAAAASGVLGVVIAVVAGFVAAGSSPDAMPPATSTTTPRPAAPTQKTVPSTLPSMTSAQAPPLGMTTTTTTKTQQPPQTVTSTPQPPKLNYEVVGPLRLRSLQLGQSLDSAQMTAYVGSEPTEGSGGCQIYDIINGDGITGRVYFSGDSLQVIAARPVQTPEGVGAGWTAEQVKTVYPSLDAQEATATGHTVVPVPGNAAAVYQLQFADDVVTGVTLQFADQPCL